MEKGGAPVVGARFNPPAELAIMFLGNARVPVTLRRDPDNKHDRNAVKVLIRQSQFTPEHAERLRANVRDATLADPFLIGWIKRDSAARLAPLMDAEGLGDMPGQLSTDVDPWVVWGGEEP